MRRVRLPSVMCIFSSQDPTTALQVAAPIYGVQYFKMAGPQPKCEYCIKYYERIYRQGMFMPEFPVHPFCPHLWEVWFPWVESEFAALWNLTF